MFGGSVARVERAAAASSESPEDAAVVAWLRAPASAPNALCRPDPDGVLGSFSLGPLLFLALSCLALFLIRTTETYTARGGVGDDGVIYAAIVRAFEGSIRDLGLNSYTAQRVLNPILIRLGMDVFGMTTDTPSIIAAYKAANGVCVTGAIGFGVLSAQHLRLSRAGLLVAVLLTYFNFATLYWISWDPVLTDAMAMFAGSVQLWAYLSRRYFVLAFVSAAAGFVWPSAAHIGAALLFFARPPASADGEQEEVRWSAWPSSTPSALDLAVAAVSTTVIVWYASTLVDYRPAYGQLHAVKSVFRLSCVLLCVVVLVALRELVRIVPSLKELVRRDSDALYAKALAVLLLLTVSRAVRWIAATPTDKIPQAPEFDMSDVFSSAVFFAVQRPLVFVVAHVGFFGPAILLLMGFARPLADGARRLGFGLNAVLGVAFLMLLNCQSRGGMNFVPIILPLAAIGAARAPWTPRRLGELLVLTLFASKLWYTIIQHPFVDRATVMFHIGPWMSNEAYVAQGFFVALAAGWLAWAARQSPPPASVVWLSEEQPS